MTGFALVAAIDMGVAFAGRRYCVMTGNTGVNYWSV
jgi:hypothetical protein